MGETGCGAGRVPVRGTSSPRCICAGRDLSRDYPRAGTHRTRGQCDRPGGVTREAPRGGSGVHTPTVHRQPPCSWVHASFLACGRPGRSWLRCRPGRGAVVSGVFCVCSLLNKPTAPKNEFVAGGCSWPRCHRHDRAQSTCRTPVLTLWRTEAPSAPALFARTFVLAVYGHLQL